MASIQVELTFTAQLQDIRKRIRSSFKRSHDSLVVRESNLISCVDEIETEFNHKTIEIQELLSELDKISNTLSDTQQLIHSMLSNKLTELTAVKYNTIELEWDGKFDTNIEKIGTIKLNGHRFPKHNSSTVPDYREKQLPQISCCKTSTELKAPGVFSNPRGIGVHYKTGRIFIADRDNNRIQVFSRNGEFLSTITYDIPGDESFYLFDAVYMNKPWGICVYQDRLIVTEEHGVCMFELNGALIRTIGDYGIGKGEFNIPMGLDVSEENKRIYVCDSQNHRIQIFTQDLKFHSMLGIGVLQSPSNIKITKDKIFVLNESDPCLFVFTPDHKLINRLITRGENKQINKPGSLAIDKENNIIISDVAKHCLLVFNLRGEKIQEIGKEGQGIGEFVRPFGLTLDNTGRIIVVCNKESACLQIF